MIAGSGNVERSNAGEPSSTAEDVTFIPFVQGEMPQTSRFIAKKEAPNADINVDILIEIIVIVIKIIKTKSLSSLSRQEFKHLYNGFRAIYNFITTK